MLFTVLTNSPTMPCLKHFENALSVQVDEGCELSVCTLHIRVLHSLTHRKFPISFQWFCFFSTILTGSPSIVRWFTESIQSWVCSWHLKPLSPKTCDNDWRPSFFLRRHWETLLNAGGNVCELCQKRRKKGSISDSLFMLLSVIR